MTEATGPLITVEDLRLTIDRLQTQVGILEVENKGLREELADHEAGLELRWKADRRAIARWREAGEGRDLIMPDHADLCVWLLGEHKRLFAALVRIRNLSHAGEGDTVDDAIGIARAELEGC